MTANADRPNEPHGVADSADPIGPPGMNPSSGGGAGDTSNPPEESGHSRYGGEVAPSERDAILDGTAATPTPQRGSSKTSEREINPADIDALMAAARGSDVGATGEPRGSRESDTRVGAQGRPSGEAGASTQAALEEAVSSSASPPPALDSQPFDFPSFSAPACADVDPGRVAILSDVNLGVRIELGRTRMLVEDVLRLNEGSVVELDRLAGDPVDVFANDRLVARGEVLVLNDSFCVRISEVFSRDPHRIVQ